MTDAARTYVRAAPQRAAAPSLVAMRGGGMSAAELAVLSTAGDDANAPIEDLDKHLVDGMLYARERARVGEPPRAR